MKKYRSIIWLVVVILVCIRFPLINLISIVTVPLSILIVAYKIKKMIWRAKKSPITKQLGEYIDFIKEIIACIKKSYLWLLNKAIIMDSSYYMRLYS